MNRFVDRLKVAAAYAEQDGEIPVTISTCHHCRGLKLRAVSGLRSIQQIVGYDVVEDMNFNPLLTTIDAMRSTLRQVS